jgi:hypothetical protein
MDTLRRSLDCERGGQSIENEPNIQPLLPLGVNNISFWCCADIVKWIAGYERQAGVG